MSPRFSVIIPTYNDWDALGQCLETLAAQTVESEAFEIVIGNNNPAPGVPDHVTLPPNARVVHQPKPGSYAARNAAVAEARGEVLCFTDSDCRVESDWLEQAGVLLDQGVDRIGGVVVMTPAGDEWTVPELYDRIFGLRQARYVERGYAATANLIATRALFDKVGPFNEELYSSGDKEWNLRATTAGSRIVLGEKVRVRHSARGSFDALKRKRLRIAGGRFRMKGKDKRRIWIPSPKYYFPAISALKRIWAEPGLTTGQRLKVWAMDYRLRRAELREYHRIRAGKSARRQ